MLVGGGSSACLSEASDEAAHVMRCDDGMIRKGTLQDVDILRSNSP